MAGFKETPRQKMIGMMYLVLTAMLALNVSKEILEAFRIVNESLVITNENFTSKVNSTYQEFEKQYSLNPDKVAPYWENAQKVRTISNAFMSYLDSVKYNTIIHSEGIKVGGEDGITYDSLKKITLRDIKKIDDYSSPTHYLVGSSDLDKGEGYTLEKRINQYREDLLSFIPEDRRASFNIGLITEGKFIQADKSTTTDWVYYNFNHTILAADITIFNKIAAEARNAEFDIVNYLAQDISAKDFKFSKIEAKIVAPSAYVFQGDEYKAEIFVAAVDEKNNPTVEYKMGASEWHDDFASNAKLIVGDSGIVHMSIPTRGLSPKEYAFAGRIIILDPTGEKQYYTFSNKFTVAQPSANVSATKMNVFYRGVDNPIKISAAGIPENRIDYKISVGKIKRTPKGFIVDVSNTSSHSETTITIYAKGEKNTRTKLGEQVFRLKNLPLPITYIRGMTKDQKITRGDIIAGPYLLCDLPEDVNFEYKYEVLSFSMRAFKPNGEVYNLAGNGFRLTREMIDYIQKARRGTDLVFKNIQVKGPEKNSTVPSMVITLK